MEAGGLSPARHAAAEPVRSRWTPKPEQILILESIFNSGMVNPPKDETVRIRKLLERFGAVGDANVFYWFQNRRSRSRRRQRQMQAAAAAAAASSAAQQSSPVASPTVGLPSGAVQYPVAMGGSASVCQYEQQASSSSSSGSTGGSSLGLFAFGPGLPGTGAAGYFQASCGASSPLASGLMGDVDSGGSDDLFAISRQMGFAESPVASSSVAPSTAGHQQQYYSCQSPAGQYYCTLIQLNYPERSCLGILDRLVRLFHACVSQGEEFLNLLSRFHPKVSNLVA